MEILGLVLAVMFFVAGIAGTFLPVLPGAPLIWLGMLVYGITSGFASLSWSFYVWQGLAVVLIFFVDYAANVWGVRKYGGSRNAVWGSLTGLLLGVLFLGPAGIIFGPFIGALAGELISQKPLNDAVKSGVGSLVGLIGSVAIKLLLEAGMITWFFIAI